MGSEVKHTDQPKHIISHTEKKREIKTELRGQTHPSPKQIISFLKE